jgi:hypothetical protein
MVGGEENPHASLNPIGIRAPEMWLEVEVTPLYPTIPSSTSNINSRAHGVNSRAATEALLLVDGNIILCRKHIIVFRMHRTQCMDSASDWTPLASFSYLPELSQYMRLYAMHYNLCWLCLFDVQAWVCCF